MLNKLDNIPADMQAHVQALQASDEFMVLRRFHGQSLFTPDNVPEDAAIGIVLDTETTGRDPETDRIVELGLISFAFNRHTGEIYSALEAFNALEDPGFPIPEDATRINGITDEMVKGKRIDDAEVQLTVEMADLVIAHNAGFDRKFCEKRFPVFKDKAWACSMTQMDWGAVGIGSVKQEFIAYRMGFFYDAHRAQSDCLALLHAMNQPLAQLEQRRPMSEVLANYTKEHRRIWAVAAPFEAKDVLRAREYRWSDGSRPDTEKAWHIDVPLEAFDEELAWLRANVYNNRAFSVPVDRIDAFNRFSDRRQRMERVYA